jgi:hypothetical protein
MPCLMSCSLTGGSTVAALHSVPVPMQRAVPGALADGKLHCALILKRGNERSRLWYCHPLRMMTWSCSGGFWHLPSACLHLNSTVLTHRCFCQTAAIFQATNYLGLKTFPAGTPKPCSCLASALLWIDTLCPLLLKSRHLTSYIASILLQIRTASSCS